MREVLTYSRRGSRFIAAPAGGLGRARGAVVDPRRRRRRPGFSLADWFGREAPLIVEIGSGVGEATAALAAARPAYDVLAFEVWRPGVADGLGRVAEAGATNVRFCSVDAVWSMEHLVGPGSAGGAVDVLPRPWPKTRHHKRRLVTPDFARLAASRLRPGRLVAAGHRLGRLRRADGGGPRRRAALDGRRGAAVGRAAGHEVRAQGRRRGAVDHRPGLRAPLTAGVRRAPLRPAGAGSAAGPACAGARRSTAPAGTRPRR